MEESNSEPGAEETIKLLISGDEFSANIKHQNFSVINRTPVIYTAKTVCFPLGFLFSERIVYEFWQPYQNLKAIKKKQLNPMCIFEIF